MGEFGLLPEGLSAVVAAALIAASFFTSAITAAFGIGGGLLLLVGMSYAMPVATLIPVHGLVQLGSNTGRMWVQRRHIDWGMAVPFVAGSFVGAAIGAVVVLRLEEAALKFALGCFVLFITWIRLPAPERIPPAGAVLGGIGTAFASMSFGATGPLVAALLARVYTDRRNLVASLAAIMTFQHGWKILAFTVLGFAFTEWLPVVAAMVGSGYLGTIVGSALLNRMPEAWFRRLFATLITLLALDMIRQGIWIWIGG